MRAFPRPTKRGLLKPRGWGIPDAGPAGPREGMLAAGKKRMELDRMFLNDYISYSQDNVIGRNDGEDVLVDPSNAMHHIYSFNQFLR